MHSPYLSTPGTMPKVPVWWEWEDIGSPGFQRADSVHFLSLDVFQALKAQLHAAAV